MIAVCVYGGVSTDKNNPPLSIMFAYTVYIHILPFTSYTVLHSTAWVIPSTRSIVTHVYLNTGHTAHAKGTAEVYVHVNSERASPT